MSNNAISDTCMFFFGMCIGIAFNYIFDSYNATTSRDRDSARSTCGPYFIIGIIQILLNALVIRHIRNKMSNIGLFTLGLLSFQSLVIKKINPKK